MPLRHAYKPVWWRQFLDWGFLFSGKSSLCQQELTKIGNYLAVTYHNYIVKPYSQRHHHMFGCWTQRNQSQTNQEILPLWLASSVSEGAVQAAEKENTLWSYLTLDSACYSPDPSGKVCLLEQ